MSSQTIGLALILLGAMLIYAGWTNRKLSSLLLGDTGGVLSAPAKAKAK